MTGMMAIIRVRGTTHINVDVVRTCEQLNLRTRNSCVVVQDTPALRGMLRVGCNVLTWGPASEETVAAIKKIQGSERSARMNPPRHGYGRKGVKMPFKKGGAIGNREEKINDLIARMV